MKENMRKARFTEDYHSCARERNAPVHVRPPDYDRYPGTKKFAGVCITNRILIDNLKSDEEIECLDSLRGIPG